jgi:AcrR family transcriptional regulator
MDKVMRVAGQTRIRRRSTELRAMVVDAAEYAFSQLGYKGATMAGIAERAGVARSVLTRQFATKAELFAEVMTKPLLQFIDEWTRRWTSRLDGQPTEPELVYEFISDLYRNSRTHVGALRLLMFSDEHLEPAVRQQVWTTLNEGLNAVLDIANREIGSHGYPTRHVDVTVRALISMVMGYVTLDPAILQTATTDEDEVVTHLASLILYGLALQPTS